MRGIKDPEKVQVAEGIISTTYAPSEELEKEHSGHSIDSHSSCSIHSTNSSPVSPLELALTTSDLRNDEGRLSPPPLTNISTLASRSGEFEVDFIDNDPQDPRNWPLWRKSLAIGCVSFTTWTVVFYSTSYTSSMPGMMEVFHEKSEPVTTLGVTAYLSGLAVGSLILAPLSEIHGRRPVYFASIFIFCVLILPTALAKSLAEVIVVRFFGACAGAAMIANSPGTVGDLVTEEYRALAFSIWSIGPMNGPVTGPLIGGFVVEYLGWRWTNWLVMILAGVGLIMIISIPETYAPIILQRKAAQMRKEMSNERYWSRYDEKGDQLKILTDNLTRPIILTLTEPILWFWDAYVGVIYAILYLCFVAYPLIYQDLRGWSSGITGLSFVGIGVGTMLAIVSEPLCRKMVNAHKRDPETGRPIPEASSSLVCIGALLCPIGQLWFSWTSVPITIHWVWPILAGIPFGAGNTLIFIYSTSYIAGSYGIYSASALAGNSVVRSLLGGTLPLAGKAMYSALTPQWAGTLLGLMQVLLIPIPFAFYFWGEKIRAKSKMIKRMRDDQEKSEKRAARSRKQQERRLAASRAEVFADETGEQDADIN